jgi:DNA-binding SARP family transcriptional activator
VVDAAGRFVEANPAAEELLDVKAGRATGATCCELLGCRRPGGPLSEICLTEQALKRGATLPEVRLELPWEKPTRSVWVTAAPGRGGDTVALLLRPGALGDRRGQPLSDGRELRLALLGPTLVQRGEVSIGGDWLWQRPGQLLKYLACQRGRFVAADEISEAIWPGADADTGVARVRHYIHVLRTRLEPERDRRTPSCFVVAAGGAYSLERDRVWLDVDEFESSAESGLAAFGRGERHRAEQSLERALALYRGDFLTDEPYAEWALFERERLMALESRALSALADLALREGRLDEAGRRLERLAGLEPFDTDVQRDLIALCLRRGRRSEAVRRYGALRTRLQRQFGEEIGFTLSELLNDDATEPLRLARLP